MHTPTREIEAARARRRMETSGAKTYDEMPIYGRIIINVMDYVLHNTCRVLFVFVLQIEYQLRALRPNQPKQLDGGWRFLGLHLAIDFHILYSPLDLWAHHYFYDVITFYRCVCICDQCPHVHMYTVTASHLL